jgi:hypothetical protein
MRYPEMKTPVIILCIFLQLELSSQSPFRYGQNKKVYFIGSMLREKLGIKDIYIIDHRRENDRGGMYENWDVVKISYDSSSIEDNWYPVSLDSNFRYNFDTILANAPFLNGTYYRFSDGQLVLSGGEGYGSFDYNEISRFGDSVSIMATSCTGHCGEQPVEYSKNIFSRNGRLIYTVSYPTPEQDDEMKAPVTLRDFDALLHSKVDAEHLPDTFYYGYDSKGLLLNAGEDNKIDSIDQVRKLFTNEDDLAHFKFHQCYIGNTAMEKFISRRIGYLPELVLIEIYRYGVFSFVLNESDRKYYRTGDVILER